ncbi:MAG TPA: N-6 DNA methylase, partial [Polyangiaceae bacterium]|nr:N-6 DNA methylase [Polyangiaceae bacterium]
MHLGVHLGVASLRVNLRVRNLIQVAAPLPHTLETLIAAVTEQCHSIVASGAASGTAAEDLLAALDALGTAHELLLKASGARRHSGSHYTPGALCDLVIEHTIAPLLTDSSQPLTSRRLLALRVCDPAMGTGAFLLRCCQFLAERLVNAWQLENAPELKPSRGLAPISLARRAIAQHCIHGVDRSPSAVELARVSMTLFTHTPELPPLGFTENLRCGDALVGSVLAESTKTKKGAATDPPGQPFHWSREFPQVFSKDGFDAIIGNPPWIAYAGRAAQPIEPALARYYKATSPAFAGYRTLHGLFVYRAGQLLKRGGRLGLVVPTSIVDLDGYRPTRDALETLCTVDSPLLDFGDGQFPGVFQPCVALCATRQTKPDTTASSIWTLTRNDLQPEASALLNRLAALPLLPPELFGERGFQSTAADRAQMRRQAQARAGFTVPLREGSDL